MPSPSPTTTSAVKLKRRPPLTTLATRLIATTRSTYAVFSAPASRRPSRRSRRSPDPAPPPRRWGPAITGLPQSLRWSRSGSRSAARSQRQPTLAGAVGDRRDPPVVAVAAPVEHHGLDAGGLRTLGDELADPAGLGGLVAVRAAKAGLHRRRRRERAAR